MKLFREEVHQAHAAQWLGTVRRQSLDIECTLRQLQARQRKEVLTDRIRTLQTQLRQADEEQHLQQRRLQLAQTTLSRNEQLAAAGADSKVKCNTCKPRKVSRCKHHPGATSNSSPKTV